MSHEAVFWALRQRVQSPAHGFILALLADAADGSGLCWPSIDRLCRLSRAGRATVKRALADFADPAREGGALLEIRERYADGRQIPNLYRLRLEGGVPLADCVAEESKRRARPPVDKGGAHGEPPQQIDPEIAEGGAHGEPPGGLMVSHQEPPQEPREPTRVPLVVTATDSSPVDNSAPAGDEPATTDGEGFGNQGAAPAPSDAPIPERWRLREADWRHARTAAIRRYGATRGGDRRYWRELREQLGADADLRVWAKAVDLVLGSPVLPSVAQWRWSLSEARAALGPAGVAAVGERIERVRAALESARVAS